MKLLGGFLVSLLLGAGPEALAADSVEPDVAHVRELYKYGKFDEALAVAESALDRSTLSDGDRQELHRYAGVAAFNLNKDAEAKRHFQALLRLNPDADLDPFVFTPLAIKFFDQQVRQGMLRELEQRRQNIRIHNDELAKQRAEEAERRRQLEELSRHVTVKTVEKRNFLVNFVPFGAGQFQEGRNRAAIFFSVTEGSLALTSMVAWTVRSFLANSVQVVHVLDTTAGPDFPINQYGAPPFRAHDMDNWRFAQYGSAALFYAVYAAGVFDAIYHHEDLVQTVTQTTAPEPVTPTAPPSTPAPAAPEKKGTVPVGPAVRDSGANLQPSLFPIAGGIGGGLTVHF